MKLLHYQVGCYSKICSLKDWCLAKLLKSFQKSNDWSTTMAKQYYRTSPMMVSCMWCQHARYDKFFYINCSSKVQAPRFAPVFDTIVWKHMPTTYVATSQRFNYWSVVLACACPMPKGILITLSIWSTLCAIRPRAIILPSDPPCWCCLSLSRTLASLSNL